jgi:hypothetical protein
MHGYGLTNRCNSALKETSSTSRLWRTLKIPLVRILVGFWFKSKAGHLKTTVIAIAKVAVMIGSDWIGHVTSLSVTLSEGVLVSPKSCALLDFLSFFLLQLRILVVRQSTRVSTLLYLCRDSSRLSNGLSNCSTYRNNSRRKATKKARKARNGPSFR